MLATAGFLLVGLIVFFVAFVAGAIVAPASSYDTIFAIAIVCALAGGGLGAFGVWRVTRPRSTRVASGGV